MRASSLVSRLPCLAPGMAQVGVLAIILAASSSRAHAIPPPRYWPLDVGNRWIYVEAQGDAERGDAERGDAEKAIIRTRTVHVLAAEALGMRVSFDGRQVRISGPPDLLDIELPGEGFVPYYRFQEDSFLHRDFDECNDEVTLVAASRGETVETPAGVFDGCLRLDHADHRCIDAGRISEWWKEEVGLVRWTESSIAGARTFVLERFDHGVGLHPFRRGDADLGGEVVLTDAIYVLNGLFTGGPLPECNDAADSNDDGEVNITDPVFLLGFLFLGSDPPPAPGPEAPGFDGTPDDPFACGDPPVLACESAASSTLPGVSFDLSGNSCVITLEQAAAGVTFVYRTVIDQDIPGVVAVPLDAGRCDAPDSSGLAVLEEIRGGDQVYCLCDTGLCLPVEHRVDLAKGTYEASFPWHGRNWYGPSDTSNPEGDPFPPGLYEFRVRAKLRSDVGGGVEREDEIVASQEFHLVR